MSPQKLGFIGSSNLLETGRRVVDCGMGTKPQSSGLLSKVANIFRAQDGASAKGHLDADESQHSVVGESEKNALQALIQRKRQDDLVRRREFNYLRKLRRSPHGGGMPGADASERASSFPNSSGFSVDDRASTLKKINAIEAHMISSWARSKVASTMPPSENKMVSPAATSAPVVQYAPTQPAPLRGDVPQAIRSGTSAVAASDDLDNLDLDFTGLLSTPGSTAVDTWDAPDATITAPVPTSAAPIAAPRPQPPVLNEYVATTPVVPAAPAAIPAVLAAAASTEPLPESIESALQEAAIQFAEGDSDSAEAVLLGLLQGEGITTGTADVLASALFDLYRAIGQQDGFDVVAMDYAERFGRSPAEWFSVPELLADHTAVPVPSLPSQLSAGGQMKAWESPGMLTQQAIAALRSQFSAPQATWHVDWIALSDIAPDAAPALAELLAHWCAQPVELHWSGVDALIRTLESHSPANDNTVDPLWWRLRLDALCILQRHDDFESLALDYCVVYEVSPPSWHSAACTFVQDQSMSGFGTLAEGPQTRAPEELPVLAGPFSACELVGEVYGERPEAMDKLIAAGESADHVVITCALTVRLDFPAAGAVLNWVIERQSSGCQVQFVQVPRLVAVFFQMLGIDRYAKVLVRAN